MSNETIHIVYIGEAVQDGSMDVRDLAPALLAIGEVCEQANRVVNGDRARVTVLVKADFQRGSFEVVLEVVQGLASQVQGLFTAPPVTDASSLLQSLGFSAGVGVSVIKLLKWLKGEKPAGTTTLANGNIQLTIQNSKLENVNIEVTPRVMQIATDHPTRRALEKMVKPLETEGIESIQARDDGVVAEEIAKDDRASFASGVEAGTSTEGEPANRSTRKALLEIRRLSFDPDHKNKWSFSEGQGSFNATITDNRFLDRVDQRQITFGRGDVVRVTVETETWMGPSGLKSEYRITEVQDIIPAPRQLTLDQAPFSPSGVKEGGGKSD